MIKKKNIESFSVEISGGLGNQMFQYAFARAISIKKKIPFKLDCQYFSLKSEINIIRPYELNIFKLKKPIIEEEKLAFKKSIISKINYKLNHILNFPIIFKSRIINESDFKNFSLESEKNIDGFYFTGHWQSENYFKKIESILRKDFIFKKKLDEVNLNCKNKIENSNSVSIHIRRGDYISNQSAFQNHGVCSIDYYKRAINFIETKIQNPTYFIFSDDPDWVRSTDFGIKNYHIVDWNNDNASYIDMQLMTLCKHNIIANSTFSWWGAWLNNYQKKIVIAPRNWFAKESRKSESKKIIPDGWVKI